MRILYIITSLGVGGAEKNICNLADLIVGSDKLDIDIISITKEIKIRPNNKRINLHSLNINKNPLSLIRGYIKIIKLIKKFNPNIIHSHLYHAIILSRSLKLFFPNKKIISTVHNLIEKNNLYTILLRFTDIFSDLNTTVSKSALKQYISLKIFNQKKSKFIYNGINFEKYKFNPKERKNTREKESINDNDFVFISICRLINSKGIFELLEAFKLINNKSNIKLILIGEGPLKLAIKKFISKNKLNKLIILKDENTPVNNYLSAADTFISSSLTEGFSLVSIEALANQIPIIISNIKTHKEIIGNNADFFSAGDVHDLASLMNKNIINKNSRLAEVSNIELKKIKEKFSIDKAVKKWNLTYKKLNKN